MFAVAVNDDSPYVMVVRKHTHLVDEFFYPSVNLWISCSWREWKKKTHLVS